MSFRPPEAGPSPPITPDSNRGHPHPPVLVGSNYEPEKVLIPISRSGKCL